MKGIISRLYTLYAGGTFVATFFIFYPVFLAAIYIPGLEKYGLLANHWWAKIYFPLLGLGAEVDFRFKPEKGQHYVICANHFSFFDIPSLALLPLPFKFMGKKSVMNIPLLGYVFKRLHIMVDRKEARSRSGSMKRGLKTLQKGLSLMIFPEGGIFSEDIPHMVPFRDGAFRAAITEQVPIIPVTIPNNFMILPDDGKYIFRRHKFKMVVHEPVSTQGLTQEDTERLKVEVFNVIDEELARHFPNSFG